MSQQHSHVELICSVAFLHTLKFGLKQWAIASRKRKKSIKSALLLIYSPIIEATENHARTQKITKTKILSNRSNNE